MEQPLEDHICEPSTFERIYNKYAKDVHDYLYYKYGERYHPNDKMQEAFIKLWENCKKVSLNKAKGFLFTVANNLTLNEIKHQKVVLNHQKHNPDHSMGESPEDVMRQKEYFNKYQAVLESLTQEQRLAFTLSKIEGKKHQEIADMLGVTKKVVEYRIYSAFDRLRSELEEFKIK